MNPWDAIAEKYNQDFGDEGDFSHKHIIDPALELEIGSVEGKSIVELGCGTGTFARKLERKGAEVIAIDNSYEMIRLAKKAGTSNELKYIHADIAQEIPIKDSSCDIATCLMVLHSLGDIHTTLSEIWRVLKPQGIAYIVVPHPTHAQNFRSVKNLDDHLYITPQKGEFVWKQLTDSCDVPTPFYLRSFQEYSLQFSKNNFSISKIIEPIINESALEELDEVRTIEVYNRLREKPNFVIFKLKKI